MWLKKEHDQRVHALKQKIWISIVNWRKSKITGKFLWSNKTCLLNNDKFNDKVVNKLNC